MKVCPKCKSKYEAGNFCENCENEDGSPVRLEEDGISCPKCGRIYKVGTKFCSECGVKLGAGSSSPSAEGISIGDKNVISGDVIGKSESYNVTGSATIIHNEDETKKINKCHVCGSVVLRINGYDCPDCGEFTCEECFDKSQGMCKSCVERNVKTKEQQYKLKVIDCLSNDGRIDAEEFKMLSELAETLGISLFRAMELQDEVKNNSRNKVDFTTFEKLNLEKAEDLYYGKGDVQEALRLLKPIYECHKEEDKILEIYLLVLAETNVDEAKQIINNLKFDVLGSYLALVDISIKQKDMAAAERLLTLMSKSWSESNMVKYYRVLYYYAIAKQFNSSEWLDKAEEIISELNSPKNKLENSWETKVKSLISEAKNDSKDSFTEEYCTNNNLYYDFMQNNPTLTREENKKITITPEKIALDLQKYSLEELLETEDKTHDAYIQFLLCEKYFSQQDYVDSFSFAQKSAAQGNADGIARLATHYLYGNGVPEDLDEGLRLQKIAYEKGSSYAINTYGYMYGNAVGVELDLNMAYEWYRKAADLGNVVAIGNVGWCYQEGKGVTQDYNKAFEWYQKGAALSSGYCLGNLGWLYKNGYGVTQDYNKAFECFQKAANKNQAFSERELGWLYEKGYGVTQDYNKAYEWYKKAADKGDTYAQGEIGWLYKNGYGLTQDYQKAFEWYQKAANNNQTFSEREIGWLYRTGNGVPQDYNKAYEWYKKAADKEDTYSQSELGWLYKNGYGVPQDYNKAFEWYQKAADKNQAFAESELGWLYKNGYGVSQDYNKAFEWYQKAAEQNYAFAEGEIGWLYKNGYGVTQNYQKALEWYMKAADQNNFWAMAEIGWLYETGNGVAKDISKAKYYYQMAANGGNEYAKGRLAVL